MEESDDDLSYVSASDSELETETWSTSYSICSFPSSVAVRGCSSPSVSLCSFRSRKRPAPQPPVSKFSSRALESLDSSQDSTMPTFVQAFHKGTNSGDATPTSEPLVEKKSISNFVSHPIRLVASENTSISPLSEGLDENKGATKVKRPGFLPGMNLPKLQIKLIDDVLDPLSQSLPLSTTPLPHTYAPPSYSFQGNIPYPPLSTIYTTLTNAGHITDQFVSQGSPLYVTSVVHPNGRGLVPISVQPTVTGYTLPGTSQFVPVAPLTYVPPMPPYQSLLTTSVTSGASLMSGKAELHPISHSASDPSVDRVLKAGLVLAPLTQQPSLHCVSERDENTDGDDYYESDDNEEVNVRQGEEEATCHVRLVDAQKCRRAERSDSISFPHLYEEIFVSRRLNLRVTFTNLTMVVIVAAFLLPNSASLLYNFFRLVFGTLFPAYYSYKAVRTKNVKEYVKWMMYWIVFAFFTCAETITDVFLSFWFPFYYELKILVVLWLLSPATRGSSILYRKFVHPWLTKREEEIDDCIAKAKQQGYSTVVQLGTKGVNYATSVIMQTAIKGGGGLVSQLKRSYSTSEIGEDTADMNRNVKVLPSKELLCSPLEDEDIMSISSGSYESEPRHRTESESSSNRPRGQSTGRSVRAAKTRSADVSDLYFHDASDSAPMPTLIAQRRSPRTHDAGKIADGGGHVTRRSRSGDVPYATLPRTSKRTTVKKKQT